MSKIITPLNSLVLVRQIESQEKLENGLVMPTTIQDGLKRGIVVAIGDKKIPKNLVPGVTVIIPTELRNEIKIDDVKHNLLHVEEILAIES